MVVACSVVLGLSRRGTHWLFAMAEFIIQTTLYKALGDEIPPYFRSLLSDFPRDIRTATTQFGLEGKATVYAVCPGPKCHATYKPVDNSPVPTYRERCNSRRYGSRCGELLVRPKKVGNHLIQVPIKSYVFFSFKDWLAGLLSRTGYESSMDSSWKNMKLPTDGILNHIFQGSVIQNFKGPDKFTHFSLAGNETTGRYLFSLGFDSFNPLGNKMAGKKISIGMMSLVCLNLPIELRYKPENMFVTIIPGPKEPPLDTINPYVRPLVDAFLEFWTGVYFTRTFQHPQGRLVLCALVAVVCDLLAARKIGCFASCTHEYFCAICWCNRTQNTFADFDMSTWKRRTNTECRDHAEEFRNAGSEKEANSLFDRSGVRWSELLRLPYFDPSRFVVVDSMHNLFLGLIKEHFQGILGYRPDDRSTRPPAPALRIKIPNDLSNPVSTEKHQRSTVKKLITWLESPMDLDDSHIFDVLCTKWGKSDVHLSSFVYVGRGVGCISSDITSEGRDINTGQRWPKKKLAKLLLEWVCLELLHIRWNINKQCDQRRRQVVSVPRPDLDHELGRFFTDNDMSELWSDMQRMVKPSWVTSVPTTLSSGGPKLKSDQWRTVGSLYLPVTLIRLWSNVDPQDPHTQRRHDVLILTMTLLSAIAVCSSRVTSEANAHEFLTLILEYRKGLSRLFPNYEIHPNQHQVLHIPEFLCMYGPVHGWWTYPFERVIGMLQRISTNYKPGIVQSPNKCLL